MGDINLEHLAINWADKGERHLWESVHDVWLGVKERCLLRTNANLRPKTAQRYLPRLARFVAAEHTPIGGTLPRRLS